MFDHFIDNNKSETDDIGYVRDSCWTADVIGDQLLQNVILLQSLVAGCDLLHLKTNQPRGALFKEQTPMIHDFSSPATTTS